jgi:hypothetical protein
LEQTIRSGRYGLQKWLGTLHILQFDIEAEGFGRGVQPPFWTNINTPDDYEAVLQMRH